MPSKADRPVLSSDSGLHPLRETEHAARKRQGGRSKPLLPRFKFDTVRTTALVFGVYAQILGIEHGYFETLQGNVAPKGLKILAASPSELPFPFGHEPAMTVIPSFLVTGIFAILVGLAITLWSAAFIQRKYGAAVLLLLSVLLLFVGGGFGPISLLITACIGTAMIGKPLTWWRSHLHGNLRRFLANSWAWLIAAALLWVPSEYIAGRILDLRNDHRQILTNLNLMLSYPLFGFFALSLIAGFACEAERQIVSDARDGGPDFKNDRQQLY